MASTNTTFKPFSLGQMVTNRWLMSVAWCCIIGVHFAGCLSSRIRLNV
jgi:hypothetical protein